MKKNRRIRIICTCLAIVLFASMAIASGSSKTTEKASVKIADNDTKATEAKKETTAATEEEKKIEYEITNTTFTHYTNSLKREEYCGIVEISNTGSSYLYLGSCSFDLEDDDGHLLQTDKMVTSAPDVIAPGEKGYFFNNGFIDEGVSLEKGINLVPNFTIEIAKKGKDAIVEYEVSDLDLRDSDYGLGVKVTGRVTNTTNESTSSINVMIIAIFYDSNGKILDIAHTYPDEMAPGAKTSFEVSTLMGNTEISTKDVADYKVIARGTSYNW